MIGPTGAVKVMVGDEAGRLPQRRGGPGRTGARETMGGNPFSGAVYVFRAKRTDRIKLLFWDGTGVCLSPSDWRMASSAARRCRMA